MALIKDTFYKMSFPNSKKEWIINKSDVIFLNANDEFVKLRQSECHGFARLVRPQDGCMGVQGGYMTASIGYRTLRELRNFAQSEELRVKEIEEVPLMFRTSAEVKRRRVTGREALFLRSETDTVSINIPEFLGYDPMVIQVQRPLRGDNDLVVAFKPEVIEHIIKYIRHCGSDGNQGRMRPSEGLPKGVYKLKDGRYRYNIVVDGTRRLLRAPTLNDVCISIESGVPYTAPGDGPDGEDASGEEEFE